MDFAAEHLSLFGNRARQRFWTILLRNEGQIGDELLEEFIGDRVVKRTRCRLYAPACGTSSVSISSSEVPMTRISGASFEHVR